MNYETATNIELNFELSRKLNLRPYKNPEEGDDAVTVEFRNKTGFKWVDFCTDWNATMPLAVKYGITPVLDDGYGYATTDPYEIYEPQGLGEPDGFFAVEIDHDTTPLRAIVICLIKVLEAKNDSGQK